MRASSQKASAKIPQRRRGRARVAALLAAGAAVLAEKGLDGATMTAIAARAGASIGSLYQFFPTKELLADALHAADADALARMLDALRRDAAGRSAAASADALFDGLAAFLVAHPAFVVLADRRAGDSPLKIATRGRLRRELAALFAHATPPLPRARAAVMAVIVLHLMKAVVAISAEADLPIRRAVLRELRAMLRSHLDSRGAAAAR